MPNLDQFANELLFKIFTYLDRPAAFSLTCRTFRHITEDPKARADHFLYKYGPRLAIFYAIKNHAKIVTKSTAEALISAGAIVSRNLAQRLIKDYLERQPSEYFRCCWTSKLSFSTYLVFLNKAEDMYGNDLWATDAMDDWEQFRICVSLQSGTDFDAADQSHTNDTNRDFIQELVERYNVVPLPLQYCFAAISDTFVTICRIGDLKLLDLALNDLSHFDAYEFVNVVPGLIEKLIYNRPTPQHLKRALENLFSFHHRVLEDLAGELIRNCGLYRVPNVILETLIERQDTLPFDLAAIVLKSIKDKFHSIYSYNGSPDNIESLWHYFPEFRLQIRQNLHTLFSEMHNGGVVCNRNDASYYGYGVGCVAIDFFLTVFGPDDPITELCFQAIVRDICEKNVKLSTNSNNISNARNAGALLHGSQQYFAKYVEAGVKVKPEHLKMACEKGMKRRWFLKELFKALDALFDGGIDDIIDYSSSTNESNGQSASSTEVIKQDENPAPDAVISPSQKQALGEMSQHDNRTTLSDRKNHWRRVIEEALEHEREMHKAKRKWSRRGRLYRMLNQFHNRHFR